MIEEKYDFLLNNQGQPYFTLMSKLLEIYCVHFLGNSIKIQQSLAAKLKLNLLFRELG